MEKALQVINLMRDEQVFESYAIGGGIAALFYIEPVATFDLDVFVILPGDTGGLVSLSSIYSWLETHGYKSVNEQVIIEGIPVQFIPAYNDLVKDAVENSVHKQYKEVSAPVLGAEYLMAIMIQAFRPKDRDRLMKFIDETDIDNVRLSAILEKYNLKNSFEEFKRKYYGK
jgi:hypothetical protein